jgi:hypothetical protein
MMDGAKSEERNDVIVSGTLASTRRVYSATCRVLFFPAPISLNRDQEVSSPDWSIHVHLPNCILERIQMRTNEDEEE